MTPQKKKARNISLSIFISVVFAICIFIPIVILAYYRFYITGVSYNVFKMAPISHNPEDWSFFGSLMAGVFTLSGAIATFSTLIFLYIQNEKINSDAKETADKNHEFMAFQIKKMSMEKFKLHHDMFSDLLTKIEREENLKYSFASKSGLYQSVFPSNNFKSCDITSISELNEPNSELLNILNTVSIMNDKFKNKTYETKGVELWGDTEVLKQLLQAYPIRNLMPGDIFSIGAGSPLNIPNLYLELTFLEKAISNICFFCNVKFQHTNFSFQLSALSVKALTEFALTTETPPLEYPGYPLRFFREEKLCQVVLIYNYIYKLIPTHLLDMYSGILSEILAPLSPQRLYNISGLVLDSYCGSIINGMQEIKAINNNPPHSKEIESIYNQFVLFVHETLQKKSNNMTYQ